MQRHLSTVSVLHYVYGAVVCLGGLGLLTLVMLGHFLQSDWIAEQSQGDGPPAWVGGLLGALGWTLFIVVELKGLLNLVSAILIGQRRGRVFSMVVAALDCLAVPFGTALGIYTLIVLENDGVREQYALPRG